MNTQIEKKASLPLCWGKKFSESQLRALFNLQKKFKWSIDQLNYLIACIAFESGGTFSPTVKNYAGSGAIGLIQFMPTTAKGLGTTTQALAKMSFEKQLDYVMMHFRPYYKRTKTLSDMYMAILWPKAIGQPESYSLFKNDIAYRQNIGLDKDKDGQVTKLEAATKVQHYYNDGMLPSNSLEI